MRQPPPASVGEEEIRNALTALAAVGYSVREDELPRLRGVDPYEQELIVMAETSAYFHVAYKVSFSSRT